MTNPITEAVARAIFEDRYPEPVVPWGRMDELKRNDWIGHAQAATEAHLKALEEAGYVVVPREPVLHMHVTAEEVTDHACAALLAVSKDPHALDVPTPSGLACAVWEKMLQGWDEECATLNAKEKP